MFRFKYQIGYLLPLCACFPQSMCKTLLDLVVRNTPSNPMQHMGHLYLHKQTLMHRVSQF
jgi:hypothetical protein